MTINIPFPKKTPIHFIISLISQQDISKQSKTLYDNTVNNAVATIQISVLHFQNLRHCRWMWQQIVHFELSGALKCLFVLLQTCNLSHGGIRKLPKKKISNWISKSAPLRTHKEFPITQYHKINKWVNLTLAARLTIMRWKQLVGTQSFWQKSRKRQNANNCGWQSEQSQTLHNCQGVTLDGCTTGLFTHPSVIVCIHSVWHVQLWIKSLASKVNNQNLTYFFPVRGEKTHHRQRVPCESSHHWPQLFYFHNTPPQKNVLHSVSLPSITTDQQKEKSNPYLVIIKLCPVFSGGFSPDVPRHCHRLSQNESATVTSKEDIITLVTEPHVNLMTEERTRSHCLSEGSRHCAPTRNKSESEKPPWPKSATIEVTSKTKIFQIPIKVVLKRSH